MSFYEALIMIHIFSAIVGLGPGFVLSLIPMKATTMTELRHSYSIRRLLHYFVMIGGMILLITGIIMGIINPYLFSEGWYVISIVLFLITLFAGPLLLGPKLRPIRKILEINEGEEIPEEYERLARKLFFYEHITNIILLIIITLMILKPF